MISLFGDISLFLALCFASLQSFPTLIGYWRNNRYLQAFARPSAWGQFICVLSAYCLLTAAFATNDFSIAYVANNSHPSLPLMYRLTAVWGAHEGSILLWVLVLNVWTIVAAKTRDSLTLAIFGLISLCFLCFLIFTSDPFLAATTLQTGRDLNPLLQDPGFVIHPPMLYIGYVGFAAAFAITLAALIRGELDRTWATLTKRFAIAAWCFLTLGITLGSWWAYRILGWGGFWFWDPVENASLLPWIAGTALIHVLILAEKRNLATGWAALLALICFALSLLGTFLVRSGVLVSAHTFAADPARGVFLLLLLAILVTASLIIYVMRLPTLSQAKKNIAWASRDMALLINSALLFIAMLTILLGTLYPLLLDALHLGVISVGPPYFNLVMAPLVLFLMVWMGFGPLFQFDQPAVKTLLPLVLKNILLSVCIAIAVLWSTTNQLDWLAVLSLTLSCWIILSVMKSLRFFPSMSLAHIGFAMVIIGIMLSSVLSQEQEARVHPGSITTVGPYQFLFVDTVSANGPNYRGIRAIFDVTKNHRPITQLYPEKRIYTVRDMVMTKVDIHPSIFRDLYIALGEPLNQNDWSVRIYYKPFIRWIWFGGLIMMLGGMFALFNRKVKHA